MTTPTAEIVSIDGAVAYLEGLAGNVEHTEVVRLVRKAFEQHWVTGEATPAPVRGGGSGVRPAGGVTVNVTVDSDASEIGPIGLVAASAFQPAGRFSVAVPAGSEPSPERTCSVASNGVPGAL